MPDMSTVEVSGDIRIHSFDRQASNSKSTAGFIRFPYYYLSNAGVPFPALPDFLKTGSTQPREDN
jgi:hypothetical protein